MMEIGSKVIWLVTDKQDTTRRIMAEGTVTKAGKCYGEQCIWVDNAHKMEDALLAAFAWPDNEYTRLLLEDTLRLAAKHKQEEKELMARTYKMRNSLTTGEFDN